MKKIIIKLIKFLDLNDNKLKNNEKYRYTIYIMKILKKLSEGNY